MKNLKILRNVKIVFWFIILIIIGVLGYQNKAFFMAKHSFELKLPFLLLQPLCLLMNLARPMPNHIVIR